MCSGTLRLGAITPAAAALVIYCAVLSVSPFFAFASENAFCPAYVHGGEGPLSPVEINLFPVGAPLLSVAMPPSVPQHFWAMAFDTNGRTIYGVSLLPSLAGIITMTFNRRVRRSYPDRLNYIPFGVLPRPMRRAPSLSLAPQRTPALVHACLNWKLPMAT